MSSHKEIITRSTLALAFAGGAAMDINKAHSQETPESTPQELVVPTTELGVCTIPDQLITNEEGVFTVNEHVVGGPVKINGERLWTTAFSSQGEMLFDTFEFDTTGVLQEGERGFSMQVPEGMTANVTVDNLGTEQNYFVMGGNNAEICGDFAVTKMTLFTQPISYDHNKAGHWLQLDQHNKPLGEWMLIDEKVAEIDQSVEAQLERVNVDYTTMNAFAEANIELYADADPQYLCLQGVRLSIGRVLPEMDEPLLVGSAYAAHDVFASRPDLFAQVMITSEDQLYELPPGAILVYPRNEQNPYDFAAGEHHGHIGIIIGETENGDMIVGSDWHTYLANDLENMESTPTVWVPIAQSESMGSGEGEQLPENAAGGSSSSADLTSAEQIAISYEYGTVPEYYPEVQTVEAYEEAIKNEFGVIMSGFDKEQLAWTWEVLWSVSKTNFPHLVEGMIVTKEGLDGEYSEQVQCAWNGEPDVHFSPYENEVQFKNLFLHESGHFIHCREWLVTEGDFLDRMDVIMAQEDAISEYGERKGRNENFADMIMYTLAPADGFVSVGEGSPENPIYNGTKPLHQEFAMEILFGPLENLPLAPESVASE